ncbi:MAG TPA: TldD/PmbA family protein [Candidatus Nanoarchaeia archaeon]|nr:TldD/PmbA family protein [Candidatus Nanoarchaeia archaeon]
MIDKLVNEFLGKCDYVDARVTDLSKEVVMLENGDTSNVFINSKSFGVRVMVKGGWGLCYSNDFSNARSVFDKALKMAMLSKKNDKVDFKGVPRVSDDKKYKYKIDPFSVDPVNKISMLKEYESLLKKDSKIKSSSLVMESGREDRTVYAPNVSVHQEFTVNVFRASVTAKEGSVIESARKNFSRLGGYEVFNDLTPDLVSKELTARVNQLLTAKAPKPERADIICDPVMTGLFFHEAVGHACEADAIIGKASVFSGLKNSLIASEEINLSDDPTIDERGFYWYDDDGFKSKETPLIINGVLSGFMHSVRTANELGESPSGNARAMSAEFPPIPRMSNTVLKKGSHSFDDLVSDLCDGYYVKGFNGGVVDPTTGQFSFGASECYRVKNGVILEPLRDVTLAGNILESLKTIKVGNDPSMSHVSGTCGKQEQYARVGDYCPSILVKDVIVGGSA